MKSLHQTSLIGLAVALLTPHSICFAAQNERQDVGILLAAARKASGLDAARQAWTLVGKCMVHGVEDEFEFDIDGPTRYRQVATGTISESSGSNGKSAWAVNWSKIPHESSFSEEESDRLFALVVSGQWAAKNSGVEVLAGPDSTLLLHLAGGMIRASLTLDPATILPKTLSYPGSSQKEAWTFDRYQKLSTQSFPTTIIHSSGRQVDEYTIESAKPTAHNRNLFEEPALDASATTYDESNSAVEVKRIVGFMFVRPKVDGQQYGWFFLDSGADVMCIDTALARKLGSKEVGFEYTSGVVADLKTPIFRTQRFQLGPVAIDSPTFIALDMGPFSKALGIEISGICGYDFLARSVLDIDPAKPTIMVYRPGSNGLTARASWKPIRFRGQTPAIEGKFEGGSTGSFTLDTGSNSTVDFFSPTVKRLDMLSKHPTSDTRTGGAGGAAASKNGKIAYFEVGGRRFENINVGLQLAQSGAFSNPYLDGNIGMGLMSKFRLILDYSKARIGFIDVGTPTH